MIHWRKSVFASILVFSSASSLADCNITFDNWSDEVFGDLYFQIETAPGSLEYSQFLALPDVGINDPEIGAGYFYQASFDLSEVVSGPGTYDAGFYQIIDGEYAFVTRMDKPKIDVDESGNCEYYYEWTGVVDATNVSFKIYLPEDFSEVEKNYFLNTTTTRL